MTLMWVYRRHYRVVRNYLDGKDFHYSELWLSVGYFLHGAGKWSKLGRPWRTAEELNRLKMATDRDGY